MQKRHTDRKMYFRDLEITSKEFYISYLSDFTELTSKSRILEVGCGEGGNLVPFAQLGCKVTVFNHLSKAMDWIKEQFK